MTAPDRGATYQIALASTGSSTQDAWYPGIRSKRLLRSARNVPCWVVIARSGATKQSSGGYHPASAPWNRQVSLLHLGFTGVCAQRLRNSVTNFAKSLKSLFIILSYALSSFNEPQRRPTKSRKLRRRQFSSYPLNSRAIILGVPKSIE